MTAAFAILQHLLLSGSQDIGRESSLSLADWQTHRHHSGNQTTRNMKQQEQQKDQQKQQLLQQQQQQQLHNGLYSRQLTPSDIFGLSPPAQTSPEDHSTDELRTQRFDFGGGQGDAKHLGGFGQFDKTSISPAVWQWMMETVGVKSVLDIGCGRGWSTSWFLYHGVDALCVEGSHDAVSQNAVTNPDHIVEHDFTLGSWWPSQTYDVAWVAEFVQQVSWMYSPNYIPALRKTALLFVTTPWDSGWHHVEVHSADWWIHRFELLGWKFNPVLTSTVRTLAADETASKSLAPDGSLYAPFLIMKTVLVFENPEIARLPQHAHLFPEPGCFKSRTERAYEAPFVQRECATGAGVKLETKLDKWFQPLSAIKTSDSLWAKRVQPLLKLRRPALPRDSVNTSSLMLLDDDHESMEIVPELRLPPIDRKLNISSHAVGRIVADWQAGRLTTIPQIPVALWPTLEFEAENAESKQIEIDGVQQSAFLTLSTSMFDFDPNVVWVGDTGFAYGWSFWCGKFNELVEAAKQQRAKRGLSLQWPIVIVHFGDGPALQRCYDVEASVGPEMVKYTQRSIVFGRRWNETRQWVNPGDVINLTEDGKTYQHTSLVVRTDTVVALDQVLRQRNVKLSSPIERLERTKDLTQFWPAKVAGDGNDDTVGGVESKLRTRVSAMIATMGANASYYTAHGKPLSVYVGLAGKPAFDGRQTVAKEYIESLLNTKIIVITQRDAWEDHYRLFEGLVSGAMVLCDRMLSLPDGLQNGTHLIEFTSDSDFVQKALYYLEHDRERLSIAHEGRRVSMSRHRSWHRMEEIVFGQPLSICSEAADSDCPYTVHANETAPVLSQKAAGLSRLAKTLRH